jgi:hypothetical protein
MGFKNHVNKIDPGASRGVESELKKKLRFLIKALEMPHGQPCKGFFRILPTEVARKRPDDNIFTSFVHLLE